MASVIGNTSGTLSGSGTVNATLSASGSHTNATAFVLVMSRGVITTQTHSVTYGGVAMTLGVRRDYSPNGFARGRVEIWYHHRGSVSNPSDNVAVTMSNGSGCALSFTAYLYEGMEQVGPTGSGAQSFDSAGATASLNVPGSNDFAIAALQIAANVVPSNQGDQAQLDILSISGGNGTHNHVSSWLETGGLASTIQWGGINASFGIVGLYMALSAGLPPPTITSVNGGSTISSIDTNLTVNGTNYNAPGTTQLWYADGTNYAAATKVQQSISAVTATTLNWIEVDVGAVGGGANYLFVVTDAGGANEQVSNAFALTVNVPAAPVITDINGGSPVDVSDTAVPVTGTTLFTTGTSVLYLADSSNFGTATLVQQTTSAVGTTSITWDAVTLGPLSAGALFAFVVTDEGGLNEQVSNAYALTITEPTTPGITEVDGGVNEVYNYNTSIPVAGTDFVGGTTVLTLADSNSFGTAAKETQSYTGLSATALTWSAVTLGALSAGPLFLYVTTNQGTPQERTSAAFPIVVWTPTAPSITAVDGGSSVDENETTIPCSGTALSRPGATELWYANSTDFNTATKVQQSISNVTDTTFTWNSITLGAVGTGANYLFFVTGADTAQPQVSAAFGLTVQSILGDPTIFTLGEPEANIMFPLYLDPIIVEPDENVLLIRDHAAWTALGTWYYARNFLQSPSASGNIVLKGQLDGPWPLTKSVRINSVAVSGTDQLVALENLNIFTEPARSVFCAGMWLHVDDMLTRGDVNNLSLFQIEKAAPGEYLEIFVQDVAGQLRLGVAYDNGTRYTLLHSTPLADIAQPIPGWIFVYAEWATAFPNLRIYAGGTDEASNQGAGVTAGLYEYAFLAHDFGLAGGDNTPDLMYRFMGLFYGFADTIVSTADLDGLNNSLTRLQYELTLKALLGSGQAGSDGPVRYLRGDDKVPDRFVHNHALSFEPGRAVGAGFTRAIDVAPYGAAHRLQGGARIECPAEGTVTSWRCTLSGHFRYIGGPNDTGVIMSLRNMADGSGIELLKHTPGGGANEANGRFRIRIWSSGSALVDVIVTGLSIDPFDGFFYSIGLTMGTSLGDCVLSIGSTGITQTVQYYNFDVPPPSPTLDQFVAGGAAIDLHSIGYKTAIVPGVHSTYHTSWSTLLDVLTFMQTNEYTGAYWCQNEDDND